MRILSLSFIGVLLLVALTAISIFMNNVTLFVYVSVVVFGGWIAVLSFIKDPHPNVFVFFLLFATTIPLLLAKIADLPIIQLSTIRSYFHKDEWVSYALLAISLQMLSVTVLSLAKPKSMGLIAIVKARQRGRRCKIVFFALGMIFFSYMANRTDTIFSGNYGADDFYRASGPFSGWPLLFVIFSAGFVIYSGMKRRIDYFFFYGAILYWVLHGNRSEVIMQAVFPVLMYLFSTREAFQKENTAKLMAGFRFSFFRLATMVPVMIAVLVAFQFVGFYRDSGTLSGVISDYISTKETRGVSISTIGPSAYTVVAAVGVVSGSEDNYLYGSSYLNYLYRTLPSGLGIFSERQVDLADYFIAEAEAIGGAHFASEAYMNGGLFGVVLFALLVALFFDFLLFFSIKDDLFLLFLLSSVFYLPRFIWYGNIYMYKLFIVFLILFLVRYLLRFSLSVFSEGNHISTYFLKTK